MYVLQRSVVLWIVFLCVACPSLATATPHPYRIAYLESGSYWLYSNTYKAIKVSLQTDKTLSIEYPEQLHVSVGWEKPSAELAARARELFAAKPDLIIAAGTEAAQALFAANDGTTPILGIAISDPVKSGVMKSPTEPTVKNFNCEILPERWKNMYRAFHEVVQFQKMGMMHVATTTGTTASGVDDAIEIGKELGFEVVEVLIPDETPTSCGQGIEKLRTKGVEAFFIGPLNCFDWSSTNPAPLINLLHKYGMATFAREGSPWVQGGALMGFSTWNFSFTGKKLALAAAQMLRGVSPDQINMAGVSEPVLSLNFETARLLGLDLSFDVLLMSEEIFVETTNPELD
ncbi:MAG: ABC transporter substrate binding protein [Bilophila sp.]